MGSIKSQGKEITSSELEYLRRKFKGFNLFIKEKREEIEIFDERKYYYLGSAVATHHGTPIDWLRRNNYFARKVGGGYHTGAKHDYYIAKKPKKEIQIIKMRKKDLEEMIKEGRDNYERHNYLKIIEGKWKFSHIRSDGKPIFYNENLELKGVSTNDMEHIGTERRTYYYTYKNKKYIQTARYHSGYGIYTRDSASIYEYKYQSELKTSRK